MFNTPTTLKDYIVLHLSATGNKKNPEAFACKAVNEDDAEDQCFAANPGHLIAWVWEGDKASEAVFDYNIAYQDSDTSL